MQEKKRYLKKIIIGLLLVPIAIVLLPAFYWIVLPYGIIIFIGAIIEYFKSRRKYRSELEGVLEHGDRWKEYALSAQSDMEDEKNNLINASIFLVFMLILGIILSLIFGFDFFWQICSDLVK